MSRPTEHVAVMVRETLEVLRVRSGGTYIDGTLGGATHTWELLEASAPDGRVISLDLDPAALERARQRLASYQDRWVGVEANFRDLAQVALDLGAELVDGVLLDLGLSSDELADSTKGLSFSQNGPLDMRLGPQANEDGLTAADIVNSWPQADIEQVIREYGEERFAWRIAEAIVRARKSSRIIGTLDLVAVIRQAVPRTYERGRIHPATRTFQALRMVVNDELKNLRQAINGAHQILSEHSRLVIISFHSLEDRVVKQAFRSEDLWQSVFRRPLVPQEEECVKNPRARSAKLRVAEKNKK